MDNDSEISPMKEFFTAKTLYRKSTIAIVLLVAGIIVGIQTNIINGYNNYSIFKDSFEHLVLWENLYSYHPAEHFDLFLYSPAFAVTMAPFSAMPLWLGLITWSLLSCTFFYIALTLLPNISIQKKIAIFSIVLIEFITSIQNNQTNAIIVCCMVLAFICFEKEKVFWAAFFIILPSSIKVFGLAAAVLFLFYPHKGKFILSMLFWGVVFAIAPIVLVPPKQFLLQYQNWYHQLLGIHHSEDFGKPHNSNPALSVMGWLKTWFQIDVLGAYIQGAGIVLLLIPLLRTKMYHNIRFRYFLLSSILIFTVIFNHIAESPTFVIAVFGVAIWFIWEKHNILTWLLLVLMMIFTVLSPTGVFTNQFRNDYVIPYVLKAVPCIWIWFYIQFRLWFGKFVI